MKSKEYWIEYTDEDKKSIVVFKNSHDFSDSPVYVREWRIKVLDTPPLWVIWEMLKGENTESIFESKEEFKLRCTE